MATAADHVVPILLEDAPMLPPLEPPWRCTDEDTAQSVAAVIRLGIMAEWSEILKKVRRHIRFDTTVLEDPDVSDELSCIAVAFAAHDVITSRRGSFDAHIASLMPALFLESPDSAFARYRSYWRMLSDADAAGRDAGDTMISAFLDWLEARVPADGVPVELRGVRMSHVFRAILTGSAAAWSLPTARRFNEMVMRSAARHGLEVPPPFLH